MKLTFTRYSLKLKHSFTIAGNSRTATPLVLLQLQHADLTGYGEASLPPYLAETQDTVCEFLGALRFDLFDDQFDLDSILDYIMNFLPGNRAAKAAIDMALHDLQGKLVNKPCFELFKANPDKMPETSFTIGIDTPEMIRLKVAEAGQFKLLKIKLGSSNDKEIVKAVRQISFKPLCVDANQGWTDKYQALDMIYWLRDEGVRFIEQPMPKASVKDMIWLTEQSPLPTIADESCQSFNDLQAVQGIFKGINIKLMKCGGINEARKMIAMARNLDLKILMGCMNETSNAIMAAASLAPFCNYADLDGPFLVTNNPFQDPDVKGGKIKLSSQPGLGLKLPAVS